MKTIRIAAGALACAIAFAAFCDRADAQPRWNLKVEAGKPGVVTVFDVLGAGTTYWYFPFSVTNKSGADQEVLLTAKALTDTNKTYFAGRYPVALRKVQRILGRKARGMSELRGTIKNDESWHAVALFRSVDPSMDRITFRLRGLEDPIVRIKGVSYLEVRSYDFRYRQSGDEYFPWEDPIEYLGRGWNVVKQRTRVPRKAVK